MMLVLVVALAVVAVVAIVLGLVARSRLRAQQAATAAAAATAEQTAEERDAEAARAAAAESARDEAAARAADAETSAAAAAARAAEADAKAADADARAAEAAALAAEAAARNGLDPQLLWTLEQARSERTWRHSVALGPDAASVFSAAEHPLRAALQVEVDAAREDIGAVVELDAELPPTVTAAGSVLVLRAVQELLARAVKVAEETVLRVEADGDDVVVTVVATDEDGRPVLLEPLAVPPSTDLEVAEGGVRVKRAIAPA